MLGKIEKKKFNYFVIDCQKPIIFIWICHGSVYREKCLEIPKEKAPGSAYFFIGGKKEIHLAKFPGGRGFQFNVTQIVFNGLWRFERRIIYKKCTRLAMNTKDEAREMSDRRIVVLYFLDRYF